MRDPGRNGKGFNLPVTINKIMETKSKINARTGKPKVSSRGGARPGAGRPRGGTNKLKMEDLLADLDAELGIPYSAQIARNYVESIDRKDWSGVRDYDKVFLGKIIADRQHVEVEDTTDALEQKKAAFAEALRDITGIKQ